MAEKSAFRPDDHFLNLKGQQYLPARWRVVWFHEEHDDGYITTELVEHDATGGLAVFKARVGYYIVIGETQEGYPAYREVYATGYGSETKRDFGDYLEKAECVPLHSRMMTRRGFKRYDELVIGEDVLAYDNISDTTVWTPLRDITVYPKRKVVALTNGWGYALECTPDHTWAVRSTVRYGDKAYDYFAMREACLLKSQHRVVLAAPAPGGDSPLTPEEAAIIGWLFTDGTIKRASDGTASRGIITQSKPQQIEAIHALVGSVATLTVTPARTMTIANNGHPSDCLPQHAFALPAEVTRALFAKAGIQTDDDLTALVTRLSVEAREAMFTAMMAADADQRGTFSKKRRPGTMEAWRALCALRGVATGALHVRDHAMPSQRARKTRHMMASQTEIEEVGLRAVWCPTTDYGTWVMEQKGVVVITGNTKAIGRALAMLGYGTAQAIELDEGERIVDSPAERQGARTEQPVVRPASSTPAKDTAARAVAMQRAQDLLMRDAEARGKLPKPLERQTDEELQKTVSWLANRAKAAKKGETFWTGPVVPHQGNGTGGARDDAADVDADVGSRTEELTAYVNDVDAHLQSMKGTRGPMTAEQRGTWASLYTRGQALAGPAVGEDGRSVMDLKPTEITAACSRFVQGCLAELSGSEGAG